MVSSMYLCVWRIFLVLFLIRAYEWSNLAEAETHPDDASHHKVAVDGGQQTGSSGQSMDAGGQHRSATASQEQGGTDSNAGSTVHKTVPNVDPAAGKVSQEGAPTSNAPAADAQQTEAAPLTNPPSDTDISGKKGHSNVIQTSPPIQSSGEALSSEETAPHEATADREGKAELDRPEGGTEGAEIQREAEESLIDEKTLGRRSLPKPVNIEIEDLLKAEMLAQQQVDFKEEDLDLPEGIGENAQQEGKEEQKEGAKETSSQGEGPGDFQGSKQEETETQESTGETSPLSRAKVVQAGSREGQEEASKPPPTAEEVPLEEEAALSSEQGEASSERGEEASEDDQASGPVGGTEDGQEEGGDASADSTAPSRDAPEEAAPETADELPKDSERVEGGPEVPEPVPEDKEAVEAAEEGERRAEEGGDAMAEDAEKEKEEEEMPSFDEWKQKMLEQHEQERQHGQAGQGVAVPPARPFSLTENSKNHASSDCGAKILNVNKEAQNAPAILQANRDVYTLNPCTANIWFVVELCEPIQVKHLEIANYELFSSVPESFRVSITDRFPTREWRPIGTFHAREERSLQSFPVLEEQMFAKYMKVEMLTFFGSEHYCPLSTLRVFGTSMVEEIDEEEIDSGIRSQSEVLPEHPVPIPEEGDRSLLQSAKGLVRNLMNAITGNGQPTPPCENKNKSCTKTGEMLPCMPQDKPKMLPTQTSSQWMAPYLFQSSSLASGFSLDPVHFRRACQGSSWCFSPNYGQTFQDCCVRGGSTAASPHPPLYQPRHRRSHLYCQDTLGLTLLPSPAEPAFIQTDSLIQKEPREKDQLERVEKSIAKSDSNQGTKVGKATLTGEGVEVGSSSPAEAATQGSVKPTPASTGQELTTPKGGVRLPQPTPSHRSTCSTVPSGHPPTPTLAPPVHLQPSPAVAEPDLLVGGGALYPALELPLDAQQQEEEEKAKEAGSLDGEAESVTAKASRQDPSGDATTTTTTEHQSPQAGKDSKQEPKAKPAPSQAANTGASKDSTPDTTPKTSAVEPPKQPDPAPSSDPSRKADATAKESEKVQVADDASGRTARGDNSAKTDPVVKSQDPSRQEGAGKGSKMPPLDPGTNGAGGIGSMAQKESVFMRLNNRIKSLELNMSLSSRYLEELSQRYRKQMDEMQKAFNKTIKTLTENAHKAEEKDQKQQEYITRLEGQMSEVIVKVETASQRLNGLHKEVIERHLFFLLVELLLMVFFFLFCRRRFRRQARLAAEAGRLMASQRPEASSGDGTRQRRNSLPLTPDRKGGGGSSSNSRSSSGGNISSRFLQQITPTKRKKPEPPPRRIRERTVSGGSCDDLLIIGPTTPFLESLKQTNESARQRSKHKTKHKPPQKSMSSSTLHRGRPPDIPSKPANKMTVAGLLFRGSSVRGKQTPPEKPLGGGGGGLSRTFSAENLASLPSHGRVQEVRGPATTTAAMAAAPTTVRQQHSAQQHQQHSKAGGKGAARKHGALMNGRR